MIAEINFSNDNYFRFMGFRNKRCEFVETEWIFLTINGVALIANWPMKAITIRTEL
jgi:hypothetical protein